MVRPKAQFKRSDGFPKIISARYEHPGGHRIGVGVIGYPGAFLFGNNVAVEDLDDAIDAIKVLVCAASRDADSLPFLY